MKMIDFEFVNSYLDNYFLPINFRFDFEILLFYFFHLFFIIDIGIQSFEYLLILVHCYQLKCFVNEVGFSCSFYAACEAFQLEFSNCSF
jgi:hypothetical protein